MAKVYKKSMIKKIENLSLDIFGFPYHITFVPELIQRFNCAGCGAVWGNEIQIDPSIPNLDILASILHEIIEVMFRKTETKYEHDMISKIEIFLMSLIIENPELMELIIETAKKEGGPLKKGYKKGAQKLVKRYKGKGWT
jgi:hypothetical protein